MTEDKDRGSSNKPLRD